MSERRPGVKPVGFNLVVAPKEVKEKTDGGLYLPDDNREREQFAQTEGVLVAVGAMAFTYANWPDGEPRPKAGDRVMFQRYQAEKFAGADGETYWMMADTALTGVFE